MYHSISNSIQNGIHPYYDIVTTPEVFDMHMRMLSENGYKVVNLEKIPSIFENRMLTEKVVAITFDDGYQDFYTNAFPLLKKYGFTADVFLPTAFIGEKRREFNSRKCLTWDEVRELSNAGICFGSHTVYHKKFNELSQKEIEHELKTSKEIIESNISKPVVSFSHPFKFPEQNQQYLLTLSELLKKNGYYVGVSTRIGATFMGDKYYFMRRIPVNRHDDLNFFKAKLVGGYNWLYFLQYLRKTLLTTI